MKDIIELIRSLLNTNTSRKGIKGRSRRGIQRARRRRELRRRMLMSAALLILTVVLILTYNSRAAEEKKQTAETIARIQGEKKLKEGAKEAAKQMEEDKLATVAEKETAKQRLKRVRKQAEDGDYPEGVIELLDKNTETVEFVENYEALKDKKVSKTIGKKLKKGKLPHLLQWDAKWGYASYGTGCIATSGCGPTCLSMVLSGLKQDDKITPVAVARYSEDNGYIDQNNNTYWALMSSAAKHWDVDCYETQPSDSLVKKELKAGHPIICSVKPGDFTQIGHFIVLTEYKDGKVKVLDPFSKKNTKKTWDYSRVHGQIKEMWVYSVDE